MNDRTLGIAAGAPPGMVPSGVAGGGTDRRVGVHRFRRTRTAFRAALNDLATTFFPADCRLCGGPLLEATPLPVCAPCIAAIQPQSMPQCLICGEALDIDVESARFAAQFAPERPSEGILCTPCRLVPPPFERAVAHGVYQGTLRELIHLLKYERVRPAARVAGAYIAQAALALPQHPMTVIAVPLFPAKQRQRGYNQAVLLADAMTAHLRRTTPGWHLVCRHDLLRRKRDTESQFALTPRGRRTNLRGAFVVPDPTAVAGLEVLLIDDIYTTGATARECARVLRRAGASKVWVVTLSRAQSEFVARWNKGDKTATWDAPLGVLKV